MTQLSQETSKIAADHHDHGHDDGSVMVFGFWVYILSDLILFATLFANYAVFASAYNGGPHGKTLVDGEQLFNLRLVLTETFLLLISSVTYGLAMVQSYKNNVSGVKMWLAITFALGASFVAMEIYEFSHFAHVLHDPVLNPSGVVSAFFSAVFALVGTHGLHVSIGLLWMLFMFLQLSRHGLNHHNRVRLTCLSIFWHFLDIVWIGVFTAVYLLGAM